MQLQVPTTSRSLVQRSPTQFVCVCVCVCGVCVCVWCVYVCVCVWCVYVCVCVCVVCVYVCVCVSVSVIGYNINLLQLQRLRRDRSRIKNYFLLNYLISRRLNSKCPTSSLPTRTGHLLLFSIFFLTLLNFHTPPNNHAICFLFHTLMWYITYN